MFQRFIDWMLGTKKEEQPYRYHRHRAWEERELVSADYIPPSATRWLRSPASIQEMLRNYKPIVRIGYGAGFAARQVEMWAHKRQRLTELRYRAARRRHLRETWGWMDISMKEFAELWPRSGAASV